MAQHIGIFITNGNTNLSVVGRLLLGILFQGLLRFAQITAGSVQKYLETNLNYFSSQKCRVNGRVNVLRTFVIAH